MKMRFVPNAKVTAGDELHAIASGFRRGEYVTVWLYTGKRFRHSSQLNGGFATGGKLDIYRQTAAGITKTSRQKLCAQGVRTKRVACGVYKVKAGEDGDGGSDGGGGSPTTGPGYTPPATGPGYVPPASG
ncbi:MAG: hypothetical protein WDZ37_06420 [Solirubrobacterales bacterium]